MLRGTVGLKGSFLCQNVKDFCFSFLSSTAHRHNSASVTRWKINGAHNLRLISNHFTNTFSHIWSHDYFLIKKKQSTAASLDLGFLESIPLSEVSFETRFFSRSDCWDYFEKSQFCQKFQEMKPVTWIFGKIEKFSLIWEERKCLTSIWKSSKRSPSQTALTKPPLCSKIRTM